MMMLIGPNLTFCLNQFVTFSKVDDAFLYANIITLTVIAKSSLS